VIGEEYYKKAFQCENERTTEAKDSFQKAIAVWKRIIEELPKSTITPQAYNFSAVCYRRLGRGEKAIEYYQKIVDNWPDYEYAWNAQFLIGYCYRQLKYAGAIDESEADAHTKAAYEMVLQRYPGCPAANAARNWLTTNRINLLEGAQK
jgi:tetratricopeptide (TPR) repeat protein